MSRFVDPSETKEIAAPWWDEGEKVVIKKFGYGARKRLAGASLRTTYESEMDANGNPVGEAQKRVQEVQTAEIAMVMLELGVKSWTLRGADGKIPACSRKNFERLDPDDGDYIANEIALFNPRKERDEEAEATFPGEPGDGDPERDGAAEQAG